MPRCFVYKLGKAQHKIYDDLISWRLTLVEGLLKEYFLVHFEVQYTNYLVYQLELDLMKSTVLIVNLAIDLLDLKALENSVQGASRAEGSFIVSTVPTSATFTYFAKSKVGVSNGEVLSTYYTQLREAGFYTGAAIGTPTFGIISQGTAGVFTNPLGATTGGDKVTWIGDTPEIGAPIQNVAGQIATAGTIGAANVSRTAGTYTGITGNSSSIVSELIVGTFDIVIDG